MLRCEKCRTDIGGCRCPNADERLRQLARTPGTNVAMKWCLTCDKHYARCECEPPQFVIITGGQVVAGDTFRTADGGTVRIDLNSR
jgi:hypothetical protein